MARATSSRVACRSHCPWRRCRSCPLQVGIDASWSRWAMSRMCSPASAGSEPGSTASTFGLVMRLMSLCRSTLIVGLSAKPLGLPPSRAASSRTAESGRRRRRTGPRPRRCRASRRCGCRARGRKVSRPGRSSSSTAPWRARRGAPRGGAHGRRGSGW
jgi:hypothetical protein